MVYSHASKLTALCLIFLSISVGVFAQDNPNSGKKPTLLFESVINPKSMTAPGRNKDKSAPLSKRSRYVSANTAALSSKETLSINLFDDTDIEVKFNKVRKSKGGRSIWRGQILSKTTNGQSQPAKGTVTLVVSDGNVTGTVRMDGKLFEIEPSDRFHSIQEIDTRGFPEDHPNSDDANPVITPEGNDALDDLTSDAGDVLGTGATANATVQADAVPSDALIKVLVVYTTAVAAQTSDINSLIDLAIDETNQSYINSSNTNTIQITLASSAEVNYTETNYTDMLTSLSATDDGVLDEVHDLRTQGEADVVIMLAAQNDYCGYGYIHASYDRAFAVVNYLCAVGNFSFAHELGHIAGGRHNIENDSNIYPYAYGHGYQSPVQTFRTIMSYNCAAGDCPRVNYWSNPDSLYSGEVMGEVDISNITQVWDENATRLATLYESYIPPAADKEVWFYNIGTQVYSSPVTDDDGNVYFAGRDANIYSLYPDGSVRWQTPLTQGITDTIAIANGMVFYRTYQAGDREFGALSALDGSPLWSKVVTGGGGGPTVREDGTSYIFDVSSIISYDSDGQELDRVGVSSYAYASPALAEDGTIYHSTGDNILRAYSPELSLLWSTPLPSYADECLTIGADGMIYVAARDGVLYAVDPSGVLQWQYVYDTTLNVNRCASIDHNHNLIIGDSSGSIHAISTDGNLVWKSQALGYAIASTAAIANNGNIYVGANSRVLALDANGQLLWISNNFTNISSFAIASNGIGYIGDANATNGGLRAFDLGNVTLSQSGWPRRGGSASGRNQFIRPANQSPVVNILSPINGASYLPTDGPITLQATATDYEEGDLSPLLVWNSDIDGIIYSPATLSVGVHVITASVTDSEQAVGTDSILVSIDAPANQPPQISISSPVNNSVFSVTDNPITLIATATDVEDGDISSTVSFSSNIDGPIASPATLSIGTHIITAQVTDSGGTTVSTSVQIEMLAANTPPMINFISPANGSVLSEDNNPIALSATASDAEDGNLDSSVIFSSNLDGIISSPANLSVGVHQITATVTDSGGLSDSVFIALEITPHINVAPQVTINSPLDGSTISEDDNPISINVSASDAEDGNLSSQVSLVSSLDGIIVSPAQLSVGIHQLTASVIDNDGASASATVTVEITAHVNLAPVVTFISPVDGYQHDLNSGPLAFDISAQDQEDGNLSALVALSSDIDGPLVSPADLSQGQHIITASVTDSQGATTIESIHIEVIESTILSDFYYLETFDQLPGSSLGWSYYQSNSLGRIQTVNGGMQMDVAQSGVYNLNEAIYNTNLSGFENAVLSFHQSDLNDEAHPIPASFTGHYNGDGVAISNDGVNWYAVLDSAQLETTSSGQTYTINLDQLVQSIQQNYDPSFSYQGPVMIKFQQYDNYPATTDGRLWDDVQLTAQVKNLVAGLSNTEIILDSSQIGSSACETLELSNEGSQSLNWNLSSDASWLTLASSSGTLTSGAMESIAACWDSTDFSVGESRTATISIQDLTNSKTHEVTFTLTVKPDVPTTPYSMSFDGSTLPDEADGWSYYTSNSTYGRIQISNGRLAMDVSSNNNYSLNEAILTLDLSNKSGVTLSFFQRETGDENHTAPATFSGHHNSDAVSVSVDGITWYTIVSTAELNVGTTGQTYTISLDDKIAAIQTSYDSSFEFSSSFMIKFQQYDNYSSTTDGREWDNIVVTAN